MSSSVRAKSLKLNIGCGNAKLQNYVNIDCNSEVLPDLVHDIRKDKLPYENGIVDEIVFFHTIEHIQKRYHEDILFEFNRVLKPNGTLFVSYPEFLRCAENYKNNYKNEREFWERTIYGRQNYASDFHVALMDTSQFIPLLRQYGFGNIDARPEKDDPWNTIVRSQKCFTVVTREDLLAEIYS